LQLHWGWNWVAAAAAAVAAAVAAAADALLAHPFAQVGHDIEDGEG